MPLNPSSTAGRLCGCGQSFCLSEPVFLTNQGAQRRCSRVLGSSQLHVRHAASPDAQGNYQPHEPAQPLPRVLAPTVSPWEPHITGCVYGSHQGTGRRRRRSWNSLPSQPSPALSLTPPTCTSPGTSSGPRGAKNKGVQSAAISVLSFLFSHQVPGLQKPRENFSLKTGASPACTPTLENVPHVSV